MLKNYIKKQKKKIIRELPREFIPKISEIVKKIELNSHVLHLIFQQ